jgi:DNA-directed RNA polymerase subunit RPC12/RpoP
MSPAPVLHGYLCRVCGEERIQTPWNSSDGYVCSNCGAKNLTPLLPVENKGRMFDAVALRAVE